MPNFVLPDEVFLRAAGQFPTPFHLYDEHEIRKRARQLNEAFSWCPDYREYFAVKATPNPFLLMDAKEFLEEATGSSVDIVRNHQNLNPRLKKRILKDGIFIF